MTLFERYLIRRLLTTYVYGVGALIVFYVVLHYVEYVDDFMDRGAVMREVFLVYYPSYVPEIVRLTSPLALFLGCVFVTSRLAQDLAITALQASGVSLYRLLRPYAVVGVLVTGFLFGFNGWVVPQTQRTVIEFEQKYLKSGSARNIEVNDLHRQNTPESVVTVGFYDRLSQIGHRVSLQEYEAGRLTARVDAARMEWIDSLGTWQFVDALVRSFDEDGQVGRRSYPTLDTTLTILPRDLARSERDVEAMTLPEARDYVEALRRSGVNNLGLPLVQYYSKYAYPVANLILVLIALPLASVRRRGGQAVPFALGLSLAFVYLALQKLTEPFGYAGTLDPLLTAWLPHALFFVVALVILVTARK
ncbi:MAG: LptF/LptG family permease [Bacteroidota bacterium]